MSEAPLANPQPNAADMAVLTMLAQGSSDLIVDIDELKQVPLK